MEYPVHVHELNVQDPYILADPDSKKYYLYANKFNCGKTPAARHGTGNTFYAMESADLITWSNPILIFEQNEFWASEDYSAPEVHYHKGKYYLIASFSAPGKMRRCQALVAENPLGPFSPVGPEALTPPAWQCMDATLYVDRNSDPWLVFAHDWVQVYDGQICAIRLAGDLSSAAGDPIVLFRGSEAPWGDDFMYCKDEGGGAAKAPWVHRMKDGGLVILWTNCSPYGYAVGIAKSLSGEIFGPWQQYDKPLYCHDGAHASIFTRFADGMLMMPLYHLGRNGPGITTIIEEVEEYNGRIEIVNEFTGNYWGSIGGHPIAYRGPGPSKDIPTYTVLGNYGGMFAKRRGKWGMAPETKFDKGKITSKD
jgi:hypothetical protein